MDLYILFYVDLSNSKWIAVINPWNVLDQVWDYIINPLPNKNVSRLLFILQHCV